MWVCAPHAYSVLLLTGIKTTMYHCQADILYSRQLLYSRVRYSALILQAETFNRMSWGLWLRHGSVHAGIAAVSCVSPDRGLYSSAVPQEPQSKTTVTSVPHYPFTNSSFRAQASKGVLRASPTPFL